MLTFERLPMVGPCKAFRPPGHAQHVFDMVGLNEHRLSAADVSLWRGLGSLNVKKFSGWRLGVVAPGNAQVVSAHDGEPDHLTVSFIRDVPRVLAISPLRTGTKLSAMAGNHVILEMADGFVLLAHLRNGSVTVSDGDTVDAGDPLGQVGNSGNSLLPHIHVQAIAETDPFTAAVLPWQVTTLEYRVERSWEPAPGPVPLRTPVRSP